MADAIFGVVVFLVMVCCPVHSLVPISFCPAGQFSFGVSCFNCLPGTYSDTLGSSACLYCPSGTYDATTGGASACTACSPGYGLGRTACELCNLGESQYINQSFVADTGNHYIRQLVLTNGWALDPALSDSIRGGTTIDFNFFYSTDGNQLFITWRGQFIYVMNTISHSLWEFAGSSTRGHVNGDTSWALFDSINNGAMGSDGNTLYILEQYHVRQSKFLENKWSTLLGVNSSPYCQATGNINIPFTNVNLNKPTGIYASPSGKFLLILDQWQNALYFVNLLDQTASIIAGMCGSYAYVDGLGPSAMFNHPTDIQVSPDESFAIISDTGNFVFRKVSFSNMSDSTAPVTVTTVLGTAGVSGNLNGIGTNAKFGEVSYFGLSPGGSLMYFGDNNQVKMADLSVFPYTVTTFSGNDTQGMGFGSSTMYNQPKRVAAFACKVLCPANFYVVVGSTVCTACPPNSSSAPKAMTCTANVGYYMMGSAMSVLSTGLCTGISQCNAGTYMVTPCYGSTNVVCAACPAGRYSQAGSTDNTGTYMCSPCAAGTFSATSGATACTACDYDTFAASTGMSACTACTIGYENDFSTYCPGDEILFSCTSISNGRCAVHVCPPKTDPISEYYQNNCVMYCPNTYYLSGTTCIPCTTNLNDCGIGFYREACYLGDFADAKCSQCLGVPNGQLTGYGTTVGDWYSCPFTCNVGYSKLTSSRECIACKPGTYTATGSASACTLCQPGTYSLAAKGSCTACPAGQYSNVTGASVCKPCGVCTAAGWYNTCGGAAQGGCTQCNNTA